MIAVAAALLLCAVAEVKVARVATAKVAATVTGSGKTDALEQQKLRAPFKGILQQLRVNDGDHVETQQVVAVFVSQESDTALVGARNMLRAAKTEAERADAQRALQLAQQGLLQILLRAREAAVVVSHDADEGALVDEGKTILTLAAMDSFVFVADVPQKDIGSIHPGQPVLVHLAARPKPLRGRVHGLLAVASPEHHTAPVRIDLAGQRMPKLVGLTGTAAIEVGGRRNARVVPIAAIVGDAGARRIAIVSRDGVLHWEPVTTGTFDSERVEISAPSLPAGTRIAIAGQGSVAEGARVRIAR